MLYPILTPRHYWVCAGYLYDLGLRKACFYTLLLSFISFLLC